MWDTFIEKISGYAALSAVFGTILIIIYILIISTFVIRKLIAPDLISPQVNLQVHKWYWITVGILFLGTLAMFLIGFLPALLCLGSLYLFFRYMFPFLVRKILL